MNTCTIYILSSVYVQYIYRILFFKFQRCESQERTMRIREAGKRKVWLFYNLLILLVNCLCCCYMYNRDVCYTELWRMIVLIVLQNRIRPIKVYQIPDGLFPGQQVMLRGRVQWGSKSWVTFIKEIQRRMCMLVCGGGGGGENDSWHHQNFFTYRIFSPDAW